MQNIRIEDVKSRRGKIIESNDVLPNVDRILILSIHTELVKSPLKTKVDALELHRQAQELDVLLKTREFFAEQKALQFVCGIVNTSKESFLVMVICVQLQEYPPRIKKIPRIIQ